jgi:hypothetical protein
VAFLVGFFFSRSSYFLEKKYVARRLGPFDVQKVSKTQKIRKNMVSCCAELKPKLRGLFRK